MRSRLVSPTRQSINMTILFKKTQQNQPRSCKTVRLERQLQLLKISVKIGSDSRKSFSNKLPNHILEAHSVAASKKQKYSLRYELFFRGGGGARSLKGGAYAGRAKFQGFRPCWGRAKSLGISPRGIKSRGKAKSLGHRF